MRNKSYIDKNRLRIIADRLRAIRKAHSLTQEAFAEALNVTRETVGQWERAATPPSFDAVVRICELYHIDADFIMGRIDCHTHDLQYIHDITGLSESTINSLIEWHQSNTQEHTWIDNINNMIDDPEYKNFMKYISYYLGTAIIESKQIVNPNLDIDNIDELKTSNLWHISHICSNIVERMYKDRVARELANKL